MPVKLRIILLFTAAVFTILLLVCASVYYVSYNNRLTLIKTRLLNRANSTASLFSKSVELNNDLVQKVDSTTAYQLRDKEVQVFDRNNRKIYFFSDNPGDMIPVDSQALSTARQKGSFYFTLRKKEVIALYYPKRDIVIVSATYDDAGERYMSQLRIILLMSLLGGTLISLVIGYFVSGRLLLPVKNIADEVNEISAKNLNRRIKTGVPGDEWHYLSSTLNDLLNRLQESFEVQRRFISDASHELSTPLTSVSNQLEVSLQRNRDAQEYRTVMASVHKDILHMSKLTQTLLEFAKASGSTGGLEIEPVRVDELILQVMQELSKINDQFKVVLGYDDLPAEDSGLFVLGNEPLLLTALKNIVHNACKYSPNRQAVVQLKPQPQKIIIEVSDNGPGIPLNELENIFRPFYRTSTAANEQGFGLGLSLAGQIIKLHKGSIEVRHVETGGSLFIIMLPTIQ